MKKIISFALSVFILLGFTGCSRTINDIIDEEPGFKGTVSQFEEGSFIVVDIYEEDYISNSYSAAVVSLEVENKDSKTHFDIGDEVAVYYDGNYTVVDGGVKLDKVYAILLIEPADRTKENAS